MADPSGRSQRFDARAGGAPSTGSLRDETERRKRARREIASPADPTGPLAAGQGRRLSDAERRALQERRRARLPGPATTQPSAPPSARGGAAPSRPIPKMPKVTIAPPTAEAAARPARAPRGLFVLGAVLIAGLAVIAMAGGRLFGAADGGESEAERVAAGVPASPAAAVGASPGPGATGVAAGASATDPALAANADPNRRVPVICLDPGHGGPVDRGFARETAPAMEEAVLTLQYAWDLEARLELQGIETVLTREQDEAVNADNRDVNGDGTTAFPKDPPGVLDELQARIDVCNAAGADLLVSIHVNGFNKPEVRGYEAWFTQQRPFGDASHRFATLAYRELEAQFAEVGFVSVGRGVLPDTESNVQSQHSVLDHFGITGPDVPGAIAASQMPGAIIESLFISNDLDAAFLASPGGRNAIVSAYELAILRYFEEYPPSAASPTADEP